MDKKEKDVIRESQDRQTLKALNAQLLHAVSLATDDFLQVRSLFRTCYGSSSAALKEEIVRSGMAEDLQYLDILKQKIEHVTILHGNVAAGDAFLCSSGSVFKLNAFQLKLADFDFAHTVQSIRSKIPAVAQSVSSAGIKIRDEHFTRAEEVSGILRNVGSHLLTLDGGYVSLTTDGTLTAAISSTYSMESERFVLQWFLDKPSAGYEELLLAYRRVRQHVSVELF